MGANIVSYYCNIIEQPVVLILLQNVHLLLNNE